MKEFKLAFNPKVWKHYTSDISKGPIYLVKGKDLNDAINKFIKFYDNPSTMTIKEKLWYVYRYDETKNTLIEVRKINKKDVDEVNY